MEKTDERALFGVSIGHAAHDTWFGLTPILLASLSSQMGISNSDIGLMLLLYQGHWIDPLDDIVVLHRAFRQLQARPDDFDRLGRLWLWCLASPGGRKRYHIGRETVGSDGHVDL